MTKIKVIKRNEGGEKSPPRTGKTTNQKPKKKRSMESTVKDWITERRENDADETRDRNAQLDSWSEDFNPTGTS